MTGVSRDVIPYGLSTGNRNFLSGINVVGLRRNKVPNKEIIGLTEAYKEIFKSENLTENLNKLNGNYKENSFVKEVIKINSYNTTRMFSCILRNHPLTSFTSCYEKISILNS